MSTTRTSTAARLRPARGFTLIELVVALFVAAIMFVFGYRALSQAISSRRELDEQTARLQALQQAMRIMEQDFELIQPRPVRNIIGGGYLPALSAVTTAGTGALSTQLGGGRFGGNFGSSSSGGGFGGSSDSRGSSTGGSLSGSTPPLVTFTRVGWTNPVGIQRSEMQRVFYAIENGSLTRSYYPVLDATEAVLPVKRVLIEHVKSFSLRFMDAGHNWQTEWPPQTLGGVTPMTQQGFRPVAVEINLEIEGWGVLTRHIEVAG
jgi:general secretion pathway protein J